MNSSNSLLLFILISSTAYAAQKAVIVAQSEAQQKLEQAITFNPAATQELIAAVKGRDVLRTMQALVQGANPNALIIARSVRDGTIPYIDKISCPVLIYVIVQGWTEMLEVLARAPGIALDKQIRDCEEEIKTRGGAGCDFGDQLTLNTPLEIPVNLYDIPNGLSDETCITMFNILLAAGAGKDENIMRDILFDVFANDKVPMGRSLIQSRRDIVSGIRDDQGRLNSYYIPLCWAIGNNNFEMVKALYCAGADITLRDIYHTTLCKSKLATLLTVAHNPCLISYCGKPSVRIIAYLLYAGAPVAPDSRLAQIIDGSLVVPEIDGTDDIYLSEAVKKVRAKQKRYNQIRDASVPVLIEHLPHAISTLVGQYIIVRDYELRQEHDQLQQENDAILTMQELTSVRRQRSADAERAAQEVSSIPQPVTSLAMRNHL